MATSITMIKHVTPRTKNIVLKVKSLVSWIQPGFANSPPTLEVVLLDKEGDKIQASLRSKSVEQYRAILTDGATVLISNFSVAANETKNSKKYNITTHPFKILFVPSTIVKIIEGFDGPMHGFNFAPFGDMKCNKLKKDDTAVADIIGCITKNDGLVPFEKGGKQNVRITTHLRDLDSAHIKCTLFGEFAERLSALYTNQDPSLPIVLIVQFGKIKDYRGELSVTNAFIGTKILVNENIKEIKEFTQSYHGWTPVVMTQGCASQSVGSLGCPSEFLKGCQHVALSDITDSDKGLYVSYASIDSIHHEDNWFYSACKKCNRKVVPLSQSELAKGNVGSGFKCPCCGPNPQSLYPISSLI